jgi:hypothetical protein
MSIKSDSRQKKEKQWKDHDEPPVTLCRSRVPESVTGTETISSPFDLQFSPKRQTIDYKHGTLQK